MTHAHSPQNKQATVHGSDSTVAYTIALKLRPMDASSTNQYQITYITVQTISIWKTSRCRILSVTFLHLAVLHGLCLQWTSRRFPDTIACTASMLIYLICIENRNTHCCTGNNQYLLDINHGKHYHLEDILRKNFKVNLLTETLRQSFCTERSSIR